MEHLLEKKLFVFAVATALMLTGMPAIGMSSLSTSFDDLETKPVINFDEPIVATDGNSDNGGNSIEFDKIQPWGGPLSKPYVEPYSGEAVEPIGGAGNFMELDKSGNIIFPSNPIKK